MIKKYTIFISLLVLGGCTIFDLERFSPSPRSTYELTNQPIIIEPQNVNARILVRLPTALTAINSNRLVVRRDDAGIAWASAIQWSDPVPEMVQARFIALFEDTKSFKAVLRPSDGISSSHHLLTDIRKFEIDGKGFVRLEFSLKILSRKTGDIIAAKIFKAQSPAGNNTNKRIQAFNESFTQLCDEIVHWVLSQV